MVSSSKMFWVAVLTVSAIFRLVVVEGLSTHYYSSSCPKLLPTVRAVVVAAVKKEARMGASLLRLHFHDCFVNGCDGSILLDDNSTFIGEKKAKPNYHSVRGYEVVDDIKEAVEKVCPGVVSCADILALAARDSTVFLGGKSWKVRLGRRDSTTANKTTAEKVLPSPYSNLCTLIEKFANQGLSMKDLVTLSGSHTIGLASCSTFRGRIYKDTNINSTFAKKLQERCPKVGKNSTLFPMDKGTPKHFDNFYYRNLMNQEGLLHSDQALTDTTYTLSIVKKYVNKPSSFFKNFAKSMVRMGNISPLTGRKGEIRINCRKVN
ncbi:hypothetical protein MRB53_003842 [Persea americana]|uniref:Uncharacterized protein n=1 Tax=Persea americana TaxID=3435 RepID=A0ACC2N058_PERAE|nr:hypothetical protein MRB53_003842 [Persea americana]